MIKATDRCNTFDCVLLPYAATEKIADLQTSEFSENNRILKVSDEPDYDEDYPHQSDDEVPLVY